MYLWSPLPRSLDATFRDAAHPKPKVRLSALEDLARWAAGEHRQRCIEQLIELMRSDRDVEVRAAAALALADASASEAVPELVAAARAREPRLRQMALVALGELATPGDARAHSVVHAALASPAPALRFQALVAANRLFAAPELLVAVRGALGDEEARVRYVACRVVEERALLDEPSGDLEGSITQLLNDGDPAVSLAAALILARRGSVRARELVVEVLNARSAISNAEDEQAAIELCGELGLGAAQRGLAARAWGGVLGASPFAFHARVALARLGDERARRLILRDLGSRDRSVRARAVVAAGLARLDAARPVLLSHGGDERWADVSAVNEALRAIDAQRDAAARPLR